MSVSPEEWKQLQHNREQMSSDGPAQVRLIERGRGCKFTGRNRCGQRAYCEYPACVVVTTNLPGFAPFGWDDEA